MRSLLIKLIGTAISFAITRYFVTSFQVEPTITSYLLASLVFLVINFFVSPILKLIFLPINLLTLGLFRWIINVMVLYLFDWLYAGIQISSFSFPGFSSTILVLPPAELSLFWTLVLSSLIMSLSYTLFTSFFKD